MIQIDNVSKSFRSNVALQDLSLQVNKGEILGLLGANGAGKTTTINLLLGFVTPDKGSLRINDLDVLNSINEVRQHVGYIPENVNLYGYLSGLENLDYFCRLAGMKYSRAELSGFLDTSGLAKQAHDQRVSGYSKGMRQKVGIAIAYAKKATVFLLDEPASGLDPLASNELSLILRKLADEGAAILMASHDIFRVREVCDRIGILRNGQLIQELSGSEVTANELEQLYLKFMKS